MIRLLADENLDNDILRGVLRKAPSLDFVRVQDVGLIGADDPSVLAWAAAEKRVVVTHDVKTMTRYALERVEQNLPMPGICDVPRSLAVGRAIEDVLLLAECSREGEWEGQVLFLPLS